MKPAFLHRRDAALIALLTLTAAGLTLSRSSIDPTLGGLVLLAVAAFKARLVVLDYFGLRDAAGPWRAILTAWIAMVVIAAATASIASAMTRGLH